MAAATSTTNSTIVSTSLTIHSSPRTVVTTSTSITPTKVTYTKPSSYQTRSSTGTKVVSHFMKKTSPPTRPQKVLVEAEYEGDESDGEATTPTNEKPTIYDNYSLYKMIVQRDEQLHSLSEAHDDMAKRIAKLEQKVDYQQSLISIKDCVVKALEGEIHRLQQYTRRYSVNIVGIPKPRGEKVVDLQKKVEDIITSTDSGISPADIDKLHRNGRAKGEEQDTIVRFKTHAAKEAFYKRRKTIQETHRNILIRPSLSPAQKSLLDDARDFLKTSKFKETKCVNPPEFVFANVHGNIQVKMKNETRQGLFFTIRSVQHLVEVIERAQDSSDDDMGFDLFD